MSFKRIHQDTFEPDDRTTSEDEDDDEVMELQSRRPGRPRRVSAASDSLDMIQNDDDDELNPTRSAAIAANLPGAEGTRKRGRGPSKKPCLNRNAQMARENRQRKKVYMKTIEDKLNEYHSKSKNLTSIIEKQNKQIKDLTNSVTYYQSVLANQSEVTTLLTALNESIKTLHGKKDTTATDIASSLSNVTSAVQQVNQTVDKYKWSDVCHEEKNTMNNPSQQINIQPKTARKTMPIVKNVEESSSIENEPSKFEQSPESHSYCEYNFMDTNSAGPSSASGNRLSTTLSDDQSNSLDQEDASLPESDLEALSILNDDNFLFDNICDETPGSPNNVIPQDQRSNNEFDDFFQNFDNKNPKLSNDEIDDLLNIDETSRFNKTLFNTLNPHTGICLHINSSRVSLEYCHACYKKSLSKLND